MRQDPCRFCRLYALSLPPIAVVLGLLLTWQAAVLAEPGRAVAGGSVLVSLLRSVAPAANGSAILIALVFWAHPLSPSNIQAELPAISKRVGFVCLPGFLAAVLLSWAASWSFGLGLLELPASVFSTASLRRVDAGFALLATLADAAVIALCAWRGLSRLQAARFSLPAKLALSWAVLFPVRAVVGLVLESTLPG
jgi:hypothetical protein